MNQAAWALDHSAACKGPMTYFGKAFFDADRACGEYEARLRCGGEAQNKYQ